MKTKLIRLLALVSCVALCFGTFAGIAAFAEDETSGTSSELTWEDIWKNTKEPAYMSTAFANVKERIRGSGVIEPMQLYCIVDGYAFYGDPITGEMIFLVLKDQNLTKDQVLEGEDIPEYSAFYCTNPYNAGAAKALGATNDTDVTEKAKLLSQVMIKYSENDKDSEMNSFKDAAANNQIVVKNIRGGVRAEYTVGREEVIYLVPRVIRATKFDALKEQIATNSMTIRDSKTFDAFFILKDLNDNTLAETTKKLMEKEYPITKEFAIRVCEPGISTQELIRLEKLVKSYTDYDYDQLEADHAETEYTNSDDVPPLFKLALEYRVEDGNITIRINAGNIRFDSSVYKLSDVLILPYGGAADVNNQGYLFTPNGSGSVLRFSDLPKTFTSTDSLYGQDFAYHSVSGENKEVSRLPVFGVYQKVEKDSKREEQQPVIDPETGEPVVDEEGNVVTETVTVDVPLEIAYLAVIEEGDSLAKVNISYGGVVHNYATVYTSFNPRPKDSYILDGGISAGTNAMWTVESKRKYTGNFKLRLFILDGTEDGDVAENGADAEKSISDMAAAYRGYLVREGVLTEIKDVNKDNVPLYLETLGALKTTKTVLGVPVDTTEALTSFEDDITILEQLRNESNINNIKLILNGWFNGGLIPEIPTSIEIEECLGDEEGFEKLISYAKEHNGVSVFPNFEFTMAFSDGMFDDFSPSDDLSQTIDERSAFMREYDPVWQCFLTSNYGVVSPSFFKKLYEKANEDYSKYNVGAISLGTMGRYLSSDFNNDDPLTREDSKELVIQLLDKVSKDYDKVLVQAGNKYTLPYVSDIIELPLDDSRFMYSYATVPFMSMVLHGYKEYAGTALNLAGDYNYQILKSIESGAAPYFVVAKNNTSKLKEYNYSIVSKYYSVRYSIWVKDIVTAYAEINDALKDVQDSEFKKHSFMNNDGTVVYTEYENGVGFYINYNNFDFEIEGTDIKVPANGYVKVAKDGSVIKVTTLTSTGEGE